MKTNQISHVILVSALLASGLATAGCGETKTVVVPGATHTSTTKETTITAPAAAPAKTEVHVTTPAAAPAASAPPASPGH